MKYRYIYVNAFTEDRFGGNPCMVFFEADDIDEATRLRITRESRLSECAFLQKPASDADVAARYYLPDCEIPMAGHPTVATITALMDAGLLEPGDNIKLEVGAGVMPIETRARTGRAPMVTMRQFAPKFGREHDKAHIAALYGLEAADILHDPQTVSTGTPQLMAMLRDEAALRRAQIDRPALRAYAAQSDFMGAAHLFILQGQGATLARHPMETDIPPEDPFTGSATGGMAAYLWARGLIDAPALMARQGQLMDRPGEAEVEILGPPEAIKGVKVGGAGVALMRGEIEL